MIDIFDFDLFDLCYWTRQKLEVWFVDPINNVTNYLGTLCVLEVSTEKGSDIG